MLSEYAENFRLRADNRRVRERRDGRGGVFQTTGRGAREFSARRFGARIGFCLTPLEKIFSELDDQQLAGFLEEARQIGAGKAFEICREQQYLSDSEKNLLGTFFRELGTRSAGEEKTNCDYVADRLSAALESRRAELPKKTKLSRSLCFLTGIMITIMLY